MKKQTVINIILVCAVLYIFLFSIDLMGVSMKLFGKGFANTLIETASNPFVALFIGILATGLTQSSSTTTSLTVAMVASGALSIQTAIPIIMGANIGTSVTNTLVSLGHITRKIEFKKAFAGATVHDFFNLCSVIVLFPLEITFHIIEKSAIWLSHMLFGVEGIAFKSPLKMVVEPAVLVVKNLLHDYPIIMLMIALVLLFMSLLLLVKLLRRIVLSKAENIIDKYIFNNPFRAYMFGVILTVLVQSSSVTTSLVIPLVGAGILTLNKIYPYTLGANLGTTVTAMLASLVTENIAAVIVAFSHLIFNIFGTLIFYPLKKIPITMAKKLSSIAANEKKYAIIFILTVYYIIPLLIIFIFR